MTDPIAIVSVARTPMGAFLGKLSTMSATDLGAVAIKAAVERSTLPFDIVDQVMMGCVLPAGLGQAPARQAAIGAGVPLRAGAVTVNKMCGSGMQAAIMGHDAIVAGEADVVVAGGMESMSNAPYLITRHRKGMRIGHGALLDSMFHDGLEDAFQRGVLMGEFAEAFAQRHQISRESQDAYATESLLRARRAQQDGAFRAEIAGLMLASRKGSESVTADETPLQADISKIGDLKPTFAKDGTITPASSSSISDGAAALVLARESVARRRGLPMLAHLRGHIAVGGQPCDFAALPAEAIRLLLAKVGWPNDSVDLFEVNEAFAVVALSTMSALALPHAKVNVNGGACAIGHPIGASGARIIVTLVSAMQARNARRGVAAICLGGGEATAVAVELL